MVKILFEAWAKVNPHFGGLFKTFN